MFRPIDPLILSQTRTTFSLLVLLPVLVAGHGWKRVKLPARDLAFCFLLGTLGVAVSNYFYYVAIQRTNVATAIIVQYTAPVWVLIYVVARGQQKLSLQKAVAVALAVTGITLVIGIFGAKPNAGSALRLDSYGIVAALLASFSFAFYNVAAHGILARYDRWRVLFWTLAAAAAFWLVINPPWKIFLAHYSAMQWLFSVCLLDALGAGGVLALLPRIAVFGADSRHHCQLPRASLLDFVGCAAAGRSPAPHPDRGNCLCARGHRHRTEAGSQRGRGVGRGRTDGVKFLGWVHRG